MQQGMMHQLDRLERLATGSKFYRFIHHPFKYLMATLYRILFYPKSKKEIPVNTHLFFGEKMSIALPAGTDIFLTGGKSHSSEIRLARFIILNVKTDDCFVDVGAHFGYYTLLAARLVGKGGHVVSFEPSNKTFSILQKNTENIPQVQIHQKAISDTLDPVVFYEFPNLHSEYNTSNIDHFKNESWFYTLDRIMITMEATNLNEILDNLPNKQTLIKIDVEGAEDKAISGGNQVLKERNPIVVLEYVEPKRGNETHRKSLQLIRSYGYSTFTIQVDGSLQPVKDMDEYLMVNQLDSDNVVCIKTEAA